MINGLLKDQTVKLKQGKNIYTVLEADSSFALLKCDKFTTEEDLGDLIFCEELGQEIWIAQYHKMGFMEL